MKVERAVHNNKKANGREPNKIRVAQKFCSSGALEHPEVAKEKIYTDSNDKAKRHRCTVWEVTKGSKKINEKDIKQVGTSTDCCIFYKSLRQPTQSVKRHVCLK